MMRIVGFATKHNNADDNTSILLRPPISVLNLSTGNILAWLFGQPLPVDRNSTADLLTVRIQTQSDPFCYLRRRRGRLFDGKGVTIERYQQSPDVIRIDHEIELTVKQFQAQCPGFFYGTVKYPNLNLLLSEQLFRANILDPVKLWKVFYDCLCCESFSERQKNIDNFKRILFNKFYTTQIYDYHAKLEELKEHVASTAERKGLENSVEAMVQEVELSEVVQSRKHITVDRERLKTIISEKQRQIATKTMIKLNMDFKMQIDVIQQKICVLQNDLDDLLVDSVVHLNQTNDTSEQQYAHERFLNNLSKQLCTIKEMHNNVGKIPNFSFELEKARCIIENNRSLLMLAHVSTEHRTTYLSDLKQQLRNLCSQIDIVQNEVEQKKQEIAIVISGIDEIEDYIRTHGDVVAASERSTIDMTLNQLKENLDDYLKNIEETATLNKLLLSEEKHAWMEYMPVSSIDYKELICIATAKCAIDELQPTIRSNFVGFIFEQALEASGEKVWVKGVSCRAIFKTSEAAEAVQEIMMVKYNVQLLHYSILARPRRSFLSSILTECVVGQAHEPVQGGNSIQSYEELISDVEKVVEHLKKCVQIKHDLKLRGDTRAALESEKKKLLNELHRLKHADNFQPSRVPPNNEFYIFAKLLLQHNYSRNRQLQLQARKETLDNFVRQLDNDHFPPDWARVRLDEQQASEQLRHFLQERALNRCKFYENVRKLSDSCDALHMELTRNNEHLWTHGLPSGECRKLLDHYSECVSTIQQSIGKLHGISNEMAQSTFDDELSEKLDAVKKEIQSLNVQEHILKKRIKSSQDAIDRYMKKYPSAKPKVVSNNKTVLLSKIAQAQRELQAIPPAYKPEELFRLKKKIRILQELVKLQSSFRTTYLNNLILPTIEKLQVRKLQHVSKLVAAASQDMPELEGTVMVIFSYHSDAEGTDDRERRMSSRLASLEIGKIAAVNITIRDENGAELETIDERQQQLAFLLLFISFLYADNCKLLIIDAIFQHFFDNGIIGMSYVFRTHFPAMQFIILRSDT